MDELWDFCAVVGFFVILIAISIGIGSCVAHEVNADYNDVCFYSGYDNAHISAGGMKYCISLEDGVIDRLAVIDSDGEPSITPILTNE